MLLILLWLEHIGYTRCGMSDWGFGRPPRHGRMEIERELTAADLAALSRPRGVKSAPLKRLTAMHHSIARLMAQGEAGYAIALATGYSESRLSVLRGDPAFQELIAQKQKEVDVIQHDYYAETQAGMVGLNMDLIESIREDLEAGNMTVQDKREQLKVGLDRTGHGPQTKSQNLSVVMDLGPALQRGRLRAERLAAEVPAAKEAKILEFSPQATEGGAPPVWSSKPPKEDTE